MTSTTNKINAGMMMTNEQIRKIFMSHGFTIKEGQTDLKPYVYAAARALLSASKPAEQDEREQTYREATKPRPETSGIGEYCQPGDRREPRWIVMYDDADRSLSLFEDEQDARDCFANSEAMGWNCWLFSPTPRVPAASPAAPAQSGEPIYQYQYYGESVWRDTPKENWDDRKKGVLSADQRFRIVYAAPQPAQTVQSREDVLEKAAALCDQLAEEFPGGAADLCAKTLRRFNEQLDKQETRQ